MSSGKQWKIFGREKATRMLSKEHCEKGVVEEAKNISELESAGLMSDEGERGVKYDSECLDKLTRRRLVDFKETGLV